MIKLLVLDVDGVLTDGTFIIDNRGKESKCISYKDLDSFNLIKSLGIKTMFLTGENTKVATYFNKKFKPDTFFCGVNEKYEKLKNYLNTIGLDFSEVCYVGDGKKDIKCIEMAGLSICPSNSIDEVKTKSKIVLNVAGGSGVVYSVYKILMAKINDVKIENNESVNTNSQEIIEIFNEHAKILEKVMSLNGLINDINEAARIMIDSIKSGGIVFSCGNGGSAADSQHFTAELISRFEYDRKAIPAISLTTNSSIMTSIGNDYVFENVFSRQIEGLGRENDVLFVITTSGNSKNVIIALEEAKRKNIKTIVLTSEKCTNDMNADVMIKVPSVKTARIQEFHIIVIHIICKLIEKEFIYEK